MLELNKKAVCVLQFVGVHCGICLMQTMYIPSKAVQQKCVKGLFTKRCVALTVSKPFIKMEAFSALREDATEHRVNKKHLPGNGNTAFSVSPFDILYPKSTK